MDKFCDEKQQKILDSFYGEMNTWSPESCGYRIVSWICVAVMLIFVCFPYQEISEDMMSLMVMVVVFGMNGCFYHIKQYIRFNENQKETNLSVKLKYLPVSLREVRIYCMRKALKFQTKLFVVLLLGQIMFVGVSGNSLELANFLYPIIMGVVVPIAGVVYQVALVK